MESATEYHASSLLLQLQQSMQKNPSDWRRLMGHTVQTRTSSLHLCPQSRLPQYCIFWNLSLKVFYSSLTTLILKKNSNKKANCCNTEYSLCFQRCWWKPLTCNKTLVLMPRIVNCGRASVGCCRLHKTACLSNMTFMHREAVPERCWLNLQKSLGHTLQGVAWGFCSGEFDSITHKKKNPWSKDRNIIK